MRPAGRGESHFSEPLLRIVLSTNNQERASANANSQTTQKYISRSAAKNFRDPRLGRRISCPKREMAQPEVRANSQVIRRDLEDGIRRAVLWLSRTARRYFARQAAHGKAGDEMRVPCSSAHDSADPGLGRCTSGPNPQMADLYVGTNRRGA